MPKDPYSYWPKNMLLLSAEAARAQEHGMSYGKYVAKGKPGAPVTVEEDKPRKTRRKKEKPCAVCGNPVTGTGRKYCSPACAAQAQINNAEKKRREAGIPPIKRSRTPMGKCWCCGKPTMRLQALFCSEQCRIIDRSRKAQERYRKKGEVKP